MKKILTWGYIKQGGSVFWKVQRVLQTTREHEEVQSQRQRLYSTVFAIYVWLVIILDYIDVFEYIQ